MRISTKSIVILAALILLLGGFNHTPTASAQVPMSPVERGYYDEGYQDGINDAQMNRSSDYRRYRDKFENRYESFYMRGYQEGYNSIRPVGNWTSDQKRAYDKGYGFGQYDARNNIGPSSERYEGKYDTYYRDYFRKGYADGYEGRGKQYNILLGGVGGLVIPGYPTLPNQNTTGKLIWTGRVDDRVNITITGSLVQTVAVSGSGVSNVNYSMNKPFPRRAVNISLNKRRGRGSANILQQPDRNNNYTAIIEVYDSSRGAGDYELEISWDVANANIEEPYQPGSVTWTGRVDNRVNVVVAGDYVQSLDVASTGMSNVNYNMTGYLARRPGTVISVRKFRGRGDVMVIQQPDWNNDFTAIVQIVDNDRGADNYQIEISW